MVFTDNVISAAIVAVVPARPRGPLIVSMIRARRMVRYLLCTPVVRVQDSGAGVSASVATYLWPTNRLLDFGVHVLHMGSDLVGHFLYTLSACGHVVAVLVSVPPPHESGIPSPRPRCKSTKPLRQLVFWAVSRIPYDLRDP